MGRRWVGLAVVAAPVLLFFLLFRPVREEVDSGYRGAARANPYLAAERLFERLGADAETAHGRLDLPAATATVILLGREPLPANLDEDALVDWVSTGGRLVVTPAGVASFDALLARLGVEATLPESAEALPGAPAPRETVEVDAPGERTSLRLSVPRGRRLVQRAAGEPEEEPASGGSALLSFAIGSGEVYVLADGSFLRNESIGDLDHARLAWALARRGSDTAPEVVLMVRDAVPSLATLLTRHAWPVLIAGGLLFVSWLLLAVRRFGPARPEPRLDRRRLLEHVEAAGSFLWQQGGAEPLLESTRNALRARIQLREPAWEALAPAELARRAATTAGLSPAPVERALFGPAPSDVHGFVQSIQTLETVRRSL